MTIREYVQRRFRTYGLGIVLVYVAGDMLTHVMTPGSMSFTLAMVALCLITLFVIDKFFSIRCPRCSKPLAPVLFQVGFGLPKQRCPHCSLDVDEQMPEGGGT